MSISSQLVEIKPQLLRSIQQDPSLVNAVMLPAMSLPSQGDVDAFIGLLSPAKQQHIRAVLSADVTAITAALRKLVPRKQWQVMQAHYTAMTKEQLLKEAAEKRRALIQAAREVQSLRPPTAQEKLGEPPIPVGDLGERIDIGKAWGGLHYLLSRAVEAGRKPLNLAVLGGTEIGEDRGYGPARYLSTPQVNAVATALSAITHDALRQYYDAAAMNKAEVYPGRWDGGHDSDNLDWLLRAFDDLRYFYVGAADRGNAVIKILR
jgi:hypothetical protein